MRNILAQNIDNWVKIGASDVVLEWLQYGVKFPICNTIETFEIPNKSFSTPDLLLYGQNSNHCSY